MTEHKRCLACQGSGKIMGGGMITKDCPECEGAGKIYDDGYEKLRDTPSFKKSIANIKAGDENITDEQAEELFKTELNNLRRERKKKRNL